MRKLIVPFSIVIFFNILTPQVHGSYAGGYYPPLSPEELVGKADVIAFGTIIGYESYLGKYEMIYTDTLVDAEYYLKKSAKESIIKVQEEGGTVRIPGGRLVMTTDGVGPIGQVGNQAYFFLEKHENKYHLLTPNGLLYISDIKYAGNVKTYEKLLTLPRIYVHRVSSEEQILVGFMSLVVILLLMAKSTKKSVHIA